MTETDRARASALPLSRVTELDMPAKRKEFAMFKFADDVDLVATLDNYDKIQDEMDHMASGAVENNLKISNKVKTKEKIVTKCRAVTIPPATDGRERVSSLKKLGAYSCKATSR